MKSTWYVDNINHESVEEDNDGRILIMRCGMVTYWVPWRLRKEPPVPEDVPGVPGVPCRGPVTVKSTWYIDNINHERVETNDENRILVMRSWVWVYWERSWLHPPPMTTEGMVTCLACLAKAP